MSAFWLAVSADSLVNKTNVTWSRDHHHQQQHQRCHDNATHNLMYRLAEARVFTEDEDDYQSHVVEVVWAAVRGVVEQL